MCAHVVYVAMKDLEGVESVKVSLNQGKAFLKLAPGNRLRLGELRKLVETKGFTPKEAKIVAHGRIEEGQRFVVSGSRESFRLQASPEKVAGPEITVRGIVPEKEKGAEQGLSIERVEEP